MTSTCDCRSSARNPASGSGDNTGKPPVALNASKAGLSVSPAFFVGCLVDALMPRP
jgi:hypothetical protein